MAKVNGDEWVETSPDIIKIFNRQGLGPISEYFIYKDIKVCEFGKIDSCIEKMNKPLSTTLHGASGVGVILGRD